MPEKQDCRISKQFGYCLSELKVRVGAVRNSARSKSGTLSYTIKPR